MQTEIHGEGEDCVILHGSPLPPESVDPVRDALVSSRRVIVPHLDRLRTDLEESARELEEALHALDVDGAALVGHSLGAYRAFQLAASGAIDVTRIVAISPLVYYPTEVRAQYDELGDAIAAGALGPTELAAMLVEPWFGARYQNDSDAQSTMERWFTDAGPEGLLAAIRVESQGPDLRTRLPEIDVPVSVVVGDEDGATPVAWSEEIVELLPNAQLHVLEGVGHFPQLEAPQELLSLVTDFLR